MKNLFFLIVIFLAIQPAKAQKIRFTDTTNKWLVLNTFSAMYQPSKVTFVPYAYRQTASFNGKVYHLLTALIPTVGSFDSAWVREDTVAGKVYAFTSLAPNEFLLYDYTLQVGDTFWPPYPYNYMPRVVSSIDSTLINNTWHKVFSFKPTSIGATTPGSVYNVIEGIGTDATPLHTLRGESSWNPAGYTTSNAVICFENRGINPQLSPKVKKLDNINSCALKIGETSSTATMSIYPQPARGELHIQLPKTSGYIVLRLYDHMGRNVFSEEYHQQTHIIVKQSSLTPGIYYYRLTTDGQEYTGKIIFE